MGAAVGDHLQEAAARVVVFEVSLKVERKFIDFLAEERNLDLGRARILVMNPRLLNSLGLFRLRKHARYGST